MPLYPYRCTQCGHRFEKIQKFNAKPETVCPKCGGKLERLLTAPGLQFKGAGWYVNDYAPKSSAPAGDGAPTEKKPGAGSKPESKPDTATAGSSGKASDSGSTSTATPSAKKD